MLKDCPHIVKRIDIPNDPLDQPALFADRQRKLIRESGRNAQSAILSSGSGGSTARPPSAAAAGAPLGTDPPDLAPEPEEPFVLGPSSLGSGPPLAVDPPESAPAQPLPPPPGALDVPDLTAGASSGATPDTPATPAISAAAAAPGGSGAATAPADDDWSPDWLNNVPLKFPWSGPRSGASSFLSTPRGPGWTPRALSSGGRSMPKLPTPWHLRTAQLRHPLRKTTHHLKLGEWLFEEYLENGTLLRMADRALAAREDIPNRLLWWIFLCSTCMFLMRTLLAGILTDDDCWNGMLTPAYAVVVSD
ncbi:hypothetical protein F5Y16DRAFT_69376 [Xylariaceae sp. FL0255]|nr:hypothetical protein F5Y16DRAFT_69376 [Xylariaceae sp. FL0255]